MIYVRKTKLRTRRVALAGTFALLSFGAAGLGAGMWMADDSAEIARLRSRIAAFENTNNTPQVFDMAQPELIENEIRAVDYTVFAYAEDKAYLGVSCDVVRDPEVSGVPIDLVYDGTPASATGFEIGDVIVAVDGVLTLDSEELRAEIQGRPVGARAAITILRDGHQLELLVHLASWRVFHGD